MRRILTALVLIPIVVYVVVWADYRIFLAVLAAVSCLCYREYNEVAAGYGFGAPGVLGYGLGLALLAWQGQTWLLLVGGALLIFTLAMRLEDLSHALPRSALLVTGVVYIFGCWKCAMPLREASPHWLMYGLMLNWAGDSGAYFIGRRFGKHKLAPRVSPKKTWEGAAASVVTSILLAGGYLLRFLPQVPVLNIVLLTAAANVAGQIGDLAESAMKRGAGVKDSGSILPGHGGFLDRVDSSLFALPVIYAYLLLVG
ncbi:MAG TPA: phosphatidate cytidylyltransferase [Candidatus Sulfopaludibacter sp.]|jgi:phosphatidate cytidylyltransferase|nr:phosphatidate cytidylyltransferase [Candidatus Sulfopaludibacter sp.]